MHPQLATLVSEVPSGEQWVHEIKYDGYRLLCRIEDGKAAFLTRRGNNWTTQFPTLAGAAAALPVRAALLDGEVMRLDERGVSDFQALQNAIGTPEEKSLTYYAFDLLHLDGVDLTACPLHERKRLLARLLEKPPAPFRYSEHVQGKGAEFHRQACRLGLEGTVSKLGEAPYRPGRSREWVKVKCSLEQEFVVVGWTEPEGSRQGLGSLLLAVNDPPGRLTYAGRVGTGFTQRSLRDLQARLESLEVARSPLEGPSPPRRGRDLHWVRPVLVAQVAFTGWTRDGMARHPSFQGLREDKDPREVVREVPARDLPDRSEEDPSPPARPAGGVSREGSRARHVEVVVAGVRITHPEEPLDPQAGISKLEVVRYYEQVAELMLPHLKDRFLMVLRCPEGTAGSCFYQKHPGRMVPPSVRRLPGREGRKAVELMVADTVEAILTLVQLRAMEFHTWGSRASRPDFPDRLTFDLDPGPEVPFDRVVEAALLLREVLDWLGLRTFLKATGGNGLHVVAPLDRRHGWDVVSPFARAVAERVVEAAPDRFVSVATKSLRRGKIFVDYLRNSRGATAIAPYSTRGRPGVTVAAPLAWEELKRGLRSDSLTVRTMPARLKEMKQDPWEGFLSLRQSISIDARKRVGLR